MRLSRTVFEILSFVFGPYGKSLRSLQWRTVTQKGTNRAVK